MFCAEDPGLWRRSQVGANVGCSATEDGAHEGGGVARRDSTSCAGQTKGFVVGLGGKFVQLDTYRIVKNLKRRGLQD